MTKAQNITVEDCREHKYTLEEVRELVANNKFTKSVKLSELSRNQICRYEAKYGITKIYEVVRKLKDLDNGDIVMLLFDMTKTNCTYNERYFYLTGEVEKMEVFITE
mgnify:CR=1 FL=1|tara:strand:- start:43 stop:363 length:321 start_codon:yes stop_codon:yes gene_type:complete